MRVTAKTHIVHLAGFVLCEDSSTEKVACSSTEWVARNEGFAFFFGLFVFLQGTRGT